MIRISIGIRRKFYTYSPSFIELRYLEISHSGLRSAPRMKQPVVEVRSRATNLSLEMIWKLQ